MTSGQSQTSPSQQTRIKLDLSIEELNIVLMGLVKLPYETSAVIVDIIRSQANQQLQQAQQSQGSPLPPSASQSPNLQ